MFRNINIILSEKYISAFRSSYLIHSLIFHKIYPSRKDMNPQNGIPLESIDIIQFEKILVYFFKRNFKFIDENDIINGNLSTFKNYIYLTFDDGYYNNILILDLLKKYNAKATFYISTNHVELKKAFWWDVQYRERMIQGKNSKYMIEEINLIKEMRWLEQEEYIIKTFGESKMLPLGELDRTFTEEELQLFSKQKGICIGNHTDNHLNLTHYSKTESIDSINKAKGYLEEITQQPIRSIAYPYGYFNEEVVKTVSELDYKIGFGTQIGNTSIEEIIDEDICLKMKRVMISGRRDIKSQLHNAVFDFSLASMIKKKIF